jgi:hypothetical protein
MDQHGDLVCREHHVELHAPKTHCRRLAYTRQGILGRERAAAAMAHYTRIRPGSMHALGRSGGTVPETGYYRHPKSTAILEKEGKKKRGKGGFPPFSRRLLGRRAT